jgi:hypothetical protein
LTALLLVLILGAGIEILYGDSATFGRRLGRAPDSVEIGDAYRDAG